MIPIIIRKDIYGWTNYSGKVTTHKINESAMVYRVSKSKILNDFFVKEQRVDGSCCVQRTQIRYTLMGLGTNHQVKIPSNLFFNIKK